jgi:SAM-dependent methyltransferase
MSSWREVNRSYWDERVALHVGGSFYDVDGFKAGRSLRPYEVTDVGDVAGKALVHLQCHFGLDTLSWARFGARVVGVDFSAPAIASARALARELGSDAAFVEADVYDAATTLGRQFDVVYTGRGALCWHPDVGRWAEVVARLLRSGGLFYMTEFHPVEWIFAEDELAPKYGYVTPAAGLPYTFAGSYADPGAETAANETVQWNHPIGEVVTALVGAGLELRLLREHDTSPLRRWPFMVPAEGGGWTMPDDRPSLPFMYTVLARKRA